MVGDGWTVIIIIIIIREVLTVNFNTLLTRSSSTI